MLKFKPIFQQKICGTKRAHQLLTDNSENELLKRRRVSIEDDTLESTD